MWITKLCEITKHKNIKLPKSIYHKDKNQTNKQAHKKTTENVQHQSNFRNKCDILGKEFAKLQVGSMERNVLPDKNA